MSDPDDSKKDQISGAKQTTNKVSTSSPQSPDDEKSIKLQQPDDSITLSDLPDDNSITSPKLPESKTITFAEHPNDKSDNSLHEADNESITTPKPAEAKTITFADLPEDKSISSPEINENQSMADDKYNTTLPSDDKPNTTLLSDDRPNITLLSDDRPNTNLPSDDKLNTTTLPSDDKPNTTLPSDDNPILPSLSEESLNPIAILGDQVITLPKISEDNSISPPEINEDKSMTGEESNTTPHPSENMPITLRSLSEESITPPKLEDNNITAPRILDEKSFPDGKPLNAASPGPPDDEVIEDQPNRDDPSISRNTPVTRTSSMMSISSVDLTPRSMSKLTLFYRVPSNLVDYDPVEHRHILRPIGTGMAYINLVRTMFGAGVLGLPLATAQAGVIMGILMNISITLLIIHGHNTLLWCINEVCIELKVPQVPYNYAFRWAIKHGPPILKHINKKGPMIVSIFGILSQLGICSVYVIFTSGSLRDMCDFEDEYTALLVILIPYLILEHFMSTLKIVTYISLASSLMTISGLILVTFLMFRFKKDEKIKYYETDIWYIMYACGSYLFNMNAVAVIQTLFMRMKDPRPLSKPFGVIQIGMFVPCLVTSTFGAIGYITMGSMDENILRSLPFDQTITKVVLCLTLLAITLAFPLQVYPASTTLTEILQKYYDTSEKTVQYFRGVSRLIIVCIVFFVAYLIPFQGPLVAFVGSLSSSVLCIILPALMEVCLLYPDQYGKWNFLLVKNIIILITGFVIFSFGTVFCFKLLYLRYLHFSDVDEHI